MITLLLSVIIRSFRLICTFSSSDMQLATSPISLYPFSTKCCLMQAIMVLEMLLVPCWSILKLIHWTDVKFLCACVCVCFSRENMPWVIWLFPIKMSGFKIIRFYLMSLFINNLFYITYITWFQNNTDVITKIWLVKIT